MDEREFLDEIYALWAKTTWAENAFWMPEEVVNVPGKFKIYAVRQSESSSGANSSAGGVTQDPETQKEDRKLVATYVSDEDSDFITALHGSFPDIYRRALEAYDEADRLDVERDEAVGRIFDLESELQHWKQLWGQNLENAQKAIEERDDALAQVERLENDLMQLDNDYLSAKAEAEYWKEQAGER